MQKNSSNTFLIITNNHGYYLRQIMLQIFFWFIVFYFTFKFIFKFVLPLLITTRNVRAKMKDMRQNMGEFEANDSTTQNNNTHSNYSQTTTNATSAKGDYIDFEEVK